MVIKFVNGARPEIGCVKKQQLFVSTVIKIKLSYPTDRLVVIEEDLETVIFFLSFQTVQPTQHTVMDSA